MTQRILCSQWPPACSPRLSWRKKAAAGAASPRQEANARRARRSCASARARHPSFPPPSIVDYRPTSSLVIDKHPVPRAKFPVVDIHSHTGPTAATVASLVAQMDALNIRVLNNLSGGSGDALAQRVRYIKSTPYANRFTVFANGLNQFRSVAPGYGKQSAAQLEADVKNGAIGLKNFQRDRHGHEEGGRHEAGD